MAVFYSHHSTLLITFHIISLYPSKPISTAAWSKNLFVRLLLDFLSLMFSSNTEFIQLLCLIKCPNNLSFLLTSLTQLSFLLYSFLEFHHCHPFFHQILCILFQHHILKTSNRFLCLFPTVHNSEPYSTHKHLIKCFPHFIPIFIDVCSLFFSWRQFCLRYIRFKVVSSLSVHW